MCCYYTPDVRAENVARLLVAGKRYHELHTCSERSHFYWLGNNEEAKKDSVGDVAVPCPAPETYTLFMSCAKFDMMYRYAHACMYAHTCMCARGDEVAG